MDESWLSFARDTNPEITPSDFRITITCNTNTLENDAWLMEQESGVFFVTISGRDSNGEGGDVMNMVAIDVEYGLIFNCCKKSAIML